MENLRKVQQKLNELNGVPANSGTVFSPASSSVPPPTLPPRWIAIQGYCALTNSQINTLGNAIFDPNVGIPVKVFLDTHTGEIKIFTAHLFEGN